MTLPDYVTRAIDTVIDCAVDDREHPLTCVVRGDLESAITRMRDEAVAEAVARERERCVKIAQSYRVPTWKTMVGPDRDFNVYRHGRHEAACDVARDLADPDVTAPVAERDLKPENATLDALHAKIVSLARTMYGEEWGIGGRELREIRIAVRTTEGIERGLDPNRALVRATLITDRDAWEEARRSAGDYRDWNSANEAEAKVDEINAKLRALDAAGREEPGK